MLEMLSITGPIYLTISIGAASVRFALFSKSDMRVIGKLVINLALPCLLFNVLCQRAWPPTSGDIDDAVQILDELGLGPLVDHMPAGLSQPIGDGGWRLSSGEAARVSLARALVRRPDVLILDETVAALDAAHGSRALEVAAAHSRATVLIAHP